MPSASSGPGCLLLQKAAAQLCNCSATWRRRKNSYAFLNPSLRQLLVFWRASFHLKTQSKIVGGCIAEYRIQRHLMKPTADGFRKTSCVLWFGEEHVVDVGVEGLLTLTAPAGSLLTRFPSLTLASNSWHCLGQADYLLVMLRKIR